ncbi:hypothetical protein ACFLQR_01530, partial [Verrucomicrobiota bacterium]
MKAKIILSAIFLLFLAPYVYAEPDFTIDTTEEFDAGLKNNTATVTDILNMTSGALSLDVDGIDDSEIDQDTGTDITLNGSKDGNNRWPAESFQFASDTVVTRLGVYVFDIENSPADVYAALRSNGGDPGTVLGQSPAKTSAEISTDDWNYFDLTTPVHASAGTSYWCVFSTTEEKEDTHRYKIRFSYNNDVYSDGCFALSSNSFGSISWTHYPSSDLRFRVYSQDFSASGDWISATQDMPSGERL